MGFLDFFNRKSMQEKNIEKSFLHFESGKIKYEKNDINGALNDFTIAINLNKDLIDAFYYRGIVNLKKYYLPFTQKSNTITEIDEISKAITDLNYVIENEPNNWYAFYYRGIAYYQLDKYQKAFEDLNVFEKNVNNIDNIEDYKLKRILNLKNSNEFFDKLDTISIFEIEKEFILSKTRISYIPYHSKIAAFDEKANAFNFYGKKMFQEGIISAKKAIIHFTMYEIEVLSQSQRYLPLNTDFKQHQDLINTEKSDFLYTLSYGYFLIGDYYKSEKYIETCFRLDVNNRKAMELSDRIYYAEHPEQIEDIYYNISSFISKLNSISENEINKICFDSDCGNIIEKNIYENNWYGRKYKISKEIYHEGVSLKWKESSRELLFLLEQVNSLRELTIENSDYLSIDIALESNTNSITIDWSEPLNEEMTKTFNELHTDYESLVDEERCLESLINFQSNVISRILVYTSKCIIVLQI
jgi:hypothetical protein